MVAKVKITYSINGESDFHINEKNSWTNPTLTSGKELYEISVSPKSLVILRKIYIELVFNCLLLHFDEIIIIEDDLMIMKKKSVNYKELTDFINLFN